MSRSGRAAPGPQEQWESVMQNDARDVAIVPPAKLVSIIESAGLDEAVQFYQSGLIHAWMSRRGSGSGSG